MNCAARAVSEALYIDERSAAVAVVALSARERAAVEMIYTRWLLCAV